MRAILIHNHKAGAADHSGEALSSLIEAEGYKVRYVGKAEFGKDGVPDGGDLIVVAGGDGTVAKVLTQLKCNQPVAILPLGTANNIARSLGIKGTPEQLVAGWKSCEARAFSIAQAKGPWGKRRFVESVGLGKVADAIAFVDSLDDEDLDGMKAGKEALIRLIGEEPAEAVALELDGETVEGKFLLVEIMNIGFAGPSVKLAPQSSPSDLSLEVVLVGEDKRAEILAWLENPRERERPPFPVRRARKVSFEWDGIGLRIDDSIEDPPKKPETVKVKLTGEFLNVLVSREAQSS